MATRPARSILDGVDLSILFGQEEARAMATQSVQIGYGKATFPTASITIAGFVVEPEFVRTLASKKMGKMGRTLSIPVSQFPDIDGWLYSDQIDSPDGVIFMVQTSVKNRGVKVRDGSIFFRSRRDGEAVLVTAHIPHDARCTLRTHNHTVFSGHGDILTLEDLEAEGIVVPKNYASAYMDAEELAECYDITVIAKAKVAKAALPKIEVHTADDGTKVALKVEKPNRRMRIRR